MLIKDCKTSHKKVDFPQMRNFVLDCVEEGRKKNTVYGAIDIDVTEVMDFLKKYKKIKGTSISFTSYIIMCFTHAINEDLQLHALKKGKKLYIYDDVDCAVMIERKVNDTYQPVNYVIRSSNKKSLDNIQKEVRMAKTAPLGGDWAMNKYEQFFWKCPKWIRKIFWWISRRSTKIRKQFVGTVGVTSLGMMGYGRSIIIPITPMTLTLGIGTIEKKLKKIDGEIKERKMLNLTVCADHDVLDGGPVMRFISNLKKMISSGFSLPTGEIESALKDKTVFSSKNIGSSKTKLVDEIRN